MSGETIAHRTMLIKEEKREEHRHCCRRIASGSRRRADPRPDIKEYSIKVEKAVSNINNKILKLPNGKSAPE